MGQLPAQLPPIEPSDTVWGKDLHDLVGLPRGEETQNLSYYEESALSNGQVTAGNGEKRFNRFCPPFSLHIVIYFIVLC